MINLIEFLKRHQLIAYFVLTYVITWGLLISIQPLFLEGQKTLAPLISLGIFALALVSIGLSALLKLLPRRGSQTRSDCIYRCVDSCQPDHHYVSNR